MEEEKKSLDERLCASCDRCRSRKTKCDGLRPCGNCAAKYMKKHKLTSVEGIDPELCECIYSPAKRRGPVPGRSSQVRKIGDMQSSNSVTNVGSADMGGMMSNNSSNGTNENASWGNLGGGTGQGGGGGGMMQAAASNSMNPFLTGGTAGSNHGGGGGGAGAGGGGGGSSGGGILDGANNLQQQHQQQQFEFLQQLQQRQQQQQQQQAMATDDDDTEEPMPRRIKVEESQMQQQQQQGGVPRTVSAHSHLLDRGDPEGARLYSYFKLSVDEIFRLPPTPTDEEYCVRLNIPGITPRMIPGAHVAALSAARFAELALGAVVHNEVTLAMELCNAVVHCLRESVQEPVQAPVMFEVAKAYFLLGVFRACRGDMARYFKYRRVCMSYCGKMGNDNKTSILLASISYLDSWAYMIYNANEKVVPNVEGMNPPPNNVDMETERNDPNGLKFNCKTSVCAIVSDHKNQHWIQGAPPVYLNNEAPLHARSLDAIACAIRQCCDQANSRFRQMGKDQLGEDDDSIPQSSIITPTATAVLAHENELCSRNMVLSAYTLMQQNEASNKGKFRSEGHLMVISALDAFLENSEEDGNDGFTDSQIQSLLSVCNTIVENPFLLHHAGPTYHMVTNAAILLGHLLNGMYAMKLSGQFGSMEAAMFEEVLDTFIAVRKLLTMHRRKLPVKLRCHGIPRPNLFSANDNNKNNNSNDHHQQQQHQSMTPFVDLGETLLCPCRGCQGFVLMACSPCVAAERARDASEHREVEFAQEAQMEEMGEVDREMEGIGAEFELDDDALLGMISSLITN